MMVPHPPGSPPELRQRAEAEHRRRASLAAGGSTPAAPGDVERTLHELQVHQIELEMQNDELQRALSALDTARLRILDLFDGSPVGYVTVDERGMVMEANLRAASMLGVNRSSLRTTSFSRVVHSADQDDYFRFRTRLLANDGPFVCQMRIRRGDGAWFWGRIEGTASPRGSGRELRFVLSDVSVHVDAEVERQKLREELHQLRRMESVGRLAGGIAHDFNNMLGAILGFTELAIQDTRPGSRQSAHLEEIRTAAQRSADLTRQLLGFARRQTIVPQALDLNDVVADLIATLRRLVGESITLAWRPGPGPYVVRVDPGQIGQVLTHLCVNASDAIVGSGSITIETGRALLDADFCARHPGANPATMACLSVSDTGCGMDAEVLAHAFEPFYTTKRLGEATGLGLATVYGIVKQNEGFIAARSSPGCGATFTIYLPLWAEGVERDPLPASQEGVLRGQQTVLLVEDEPGLRHVAGTVLTNLGYRVLLAGSPAEALALAAIHAEPIHVLLTDVVMPGMSGRDLARHLLASHPELACLFMSGYAADRFTRNGAPGVGPHCIQKPFSMQQLASKMREVLAR